MKEIIIYIIEIILPFVGAEILSLIEVAMLPDINKVSENQLRAIEDNVGSYFWIICFVENIINHFIFGLY